MRGAGWEFGTVATLLVTQIVMRIFENRKNGNGGNPVVKAVNGLRDSTEREQRLTRDKIAECHANTDKRMEEHEAREERQWEAVGTQLGNMPKRGEK